MDMFPLLVVGILGGKLGVHIWHKTHRVDIPLFVACRPKKLLLTSFLQSCDIPVLMTRKSKWEYTTHKTQMHKKWTESSKAMEPNGILACIVTVWNSGIAWMDDFISDDNSLLRCIIKHPILIQILKYIINKWPLNKHSKNVKCTGWLPTKISAVGTYHVDLSYCHQAYGSNLYKLERKLTEMKETDC